MTDWTAEQTEQARLMFFEKGMSSGQIGKIMGRSRNAILGRLYRKFGPLAVERSKDRKGWRVHFRAKEADRKRVQPHKPKSRSMTPQIQTARPERSLRLTELGTRHCRWIVGYQDDEAMFCAGERTDDPTCWYCGFHRRMAWVKRG